MQAFIDRNLDIIAFLAIVLLASIPTILIIV